MAGRLQQGVGGSYVLLMEPSPSLGSRHLVQLKGVTVHKGFVLRELRERYCPVLR